MADKTPAKKKSLEDFFKPQKQEIEIPYRPEEDQKVTKVLSKSPGLDLEKKVNEAGKGSIYVGGNLKEKRGVSAAQEVPVAAPTPQAPIAPQAPIKQGGTFVPPAPVQQAPQAQMPKASQGPSVWERALIGATPLLVGWLSGNALEGAEASGKQLVDTEADLYKRERDFNGKLAEMQAKKALQTVPAGKGLQAKTFEYKGSDGQPRIGRFINGEYYRDETTDPLASVKSGKDTWITKKIQTENGPKEVAYNPVSGETKAIGDAYEKPERQIVDVDFQGEPTKAVANLSQGKIDAYLGKMASKPSSMAENGKDERQIRQIRVGLLKDITKPTSVYSQRRESLEGMNRAAQLLNDGGPIGASGLRMILARSVFGEKGPLSDGDVSRLSGDPSAQAVVSRIWDKYLSGEPLTPTDRTDVRKVIDIASNLATADANRYLDGYVDTYRAEGYDLNPQLQHFREMPSIPPFRSGSGAGARVPRGTKSSQQAPSNGLKIGDTVKGFKYKGGDPAKQESWGK